MTAEPSRAGGKASPKVTILTPVYNGEEYLVECLESVIRQTYSNWEYIIVNNCSTDNTRTIVARYAAGDSRVRIVDNTTFVGVMENHNVAFSLVPTDAKYCKLVSADDWIYPECIESMVDVAERHPSIGVVGCYAISNVGPLRQRATPQGKEFFTGREISRLHLLGTHVFGPPTSLLYRADIVRNNQPFFTNSMPSADHQALFRHLQNHDYGFVPQILTFERWHESTVSSSLLQLNSFLVDYIDFVIAFGDLYLTPEERRARLRRLFADYYDFLADRAVHAAGRTFWTYHRDRLASMGHRINPLRIAGLAGLKVLDWVGNPKRSVEKIVSRLM
jgi:glycosyltransferase involved in cell wall biosynthesis